MEQAVESSVFWEYQVKVNGKWAFARASGQRPHRYESKEEMMRVLKIIHPGEQVRIVRLEEIEVPSEDV